MEKTVSELRQVSVDLQDGLSTLEKEVKDNEHKIKHWRAELKKLQLERTGLEDNPATEELPVCTCRC